MDVEAGVIAAAPAPALRGGWDWKAPAAMVVVQLSNAGMVLLSKVAIGGGMFVFALLAYRSLFGAAIILPLALLQERGNWKEMDWNAAGWIFLNAFIGLLGTTMVIAGLYVFLWAKAKELPEKCAR